MKICIDLTSIYNKLSGIERFCLNISKNMILNDNKNEYLLIFSNEIHKEFKFIESLPNIEYKIIKAKNKLVLSQILLPLILYKNKCDLYLFLSFPSPLLFKNKNIINTVHDMTPWMYSETMSKKGLIYFRVLIRNAIKYSKLLLTVSTSSKRDIQRYFNCKNIEVIYNGVDEKFYRELMEDNIKKELIKKYNLPQKFIFTLGTVEPRKNLKLLINAFIELKKQNDFNDYKLVLSGRYGWKYDHLLESIKENNLEKDVIFTGFINDEDLPYVYSCASLFVFPSIYEGFGIPPVEAMAAGVPVVCSNSSSLPEITGLNELLFDNNNLDSLIEKIILFNSLNEEDKNTLIKYGIDRAKEFKWKDSSIKLLKIIDSINEV